MEAGKRGKEGETEQVITGEMSASLRVILLTLPSASPASDSAGQWLKCDAVISRDGGAIPGPVACSKALSLLL